MTDSQGLSFGTTIGLLNDAMRGASLEGKQIANNIANVNTPNFRTSTVSFKDALAASLGTPPDPDEMTLKTDDDRQFNINGALPPQSYDPQAQVDQTTQMRVDQSNVDIDQQSALLEENSSYRQTISQLLRKQYTFLREAIQEQTQ